jgi:hypothetical protein
MPGSSQAVTSKPSAATTQRISSRIASILSLRSPGGHRIQTATRSITEAAACPRARGFAQVPPGFDRRLEPRRAPRDNHGDGRCGLAGVLRRR